VIDLHDALAALKRVRRDDDVVIATMSAARAWMELGSHPLDFIFVPSCMGHATSLGLGLALAQPRRRVIVCNGDGSMLMNLGNLVTMAATAPPNLTVVVFDNGVYEVTGAQPVPARVDFGAIAQGCGLQSVRRYADLEGWSADVDRAIRTRGPTLLVLDTRAVPNRSGPRSPGPAADRARRFMAALATPA
jgi:thiamine pyrophosphate-dependent acetolactate synthase large subunit-like protein